MRRTIVLLALLLPSPLLGQSPVHPLDGLSLAEHWILYETLRGSGRVSDDALHELRYVTLLLRCVAMSREGASGYREGQPGRSEPPGRSQAVSPPRDG